MVVRLESINSVLVIWKDKKLELELDLETITLKELGEKLQHLTGVKADTMKLIIPQSSTKSSKLFQPFFDEHSSLKLEDIGVIEGKSLRMMGVSEHEVDQLLKDEKRNFRIAGFEEESERLKQRISWGPQVTNKLPKGPYTFHDFRTLTLPGIELNPPASEALNIMHNLAADPGIVAIMNKHRWQVGIMTEMAPEGYVGVSPVCLLGFNKNQGEEISLRLRTDDLKGFRKYQIIKKTLLHELAHMVYSEHDSNFNALDKQLNEEAIALDWTRSRGHTLTDTNFSKVVHTDRVLESESSLSHKLGAETSHMAASARAAAVAAAFYRKSYSETTKELAEIVTSHADSDMMEVADNFQEKPSPDDLEASKIGVGAVPVSVDPQSMQIDKSNTKDLSEEPDPADFETIENRAQIENETTGMGIGEEPDLEDSETRSNGGSTISNEIKENQDQSLLRKTDRESDLDDSGETGNVGGQPNIGDMFEHFLLFQRHVTEEPYPYDQELRIIQDPVIIFRDRVEEALKKLWNDLQLSDFNVVLQTLIKIIRNISENQGEMKYKRLRKANPAFQRSIAHHQAAVAILSLIGFSEDNISDLTGKSETYLVLKRDDPALLWLAKSILEERLPQ